MIIPKNSNFSKEIAKQFKQIFHKDMTLGSLQEIKNLQEDLINPVDTYLEKQVSYLEKNNANQKSVQGSRAVQQTNSQRERFVEPTVQAKTEEEKVGC